MIWNKIFLIILVGVYCISCERNTSKQSQTTKLVFYGQLMYECSKDEHHVILDIQNDQLYHSYLPEEETIIKEAESIFKEKEIEYDDAMELFESKRIKAKINDNYELKYIDGLTIWDIYKFKDNTLVKKSTEEKFNNQWFEQANGLYVFGKEEEVQPRFSTIDRTVVEGNEFYDLICEFEKEYDFNNDGTNEKLVFTFDQTGANGFGISETTSMVVNIFSSKGSQWELSNTIDLSNKLGEGIGEWNGLSIVQSKSIGRIYLILQFNLEFSNCETLNYVILKSS